MDGFTLSTYLNYTPYIMWFLLAAVLIIVELMLLQGAGVIFVAFSAITMGILHIVGIGESISTIGQIALFLLFTAVWAGLLWKPLQKITHQTGENYHDMVGNMVTVWEKDLKRKKVGYVYWGDTKMRAMIAQSSESNILKAKSDCWIHDVKNGILIVAENQPNLS